MSEPSVYTPDSIDRTLRQWSAYRSLAEGIGCSIPDAHRSAKGKHYDPLQHADRCADIERAMVFALTRWSIEWNAVEQVQQGYTLGQIGKVLHIDRRVLREAYDRGCERMAAFLGWEKPPEEAQED